MRDIVRTQVTIPLKSFFKQFCGLRFPLVLLEHVLCVWETPISSLWIFFVNSHEFIEFSVRQGQLLVHDRIKQVS